MESDTETCKCRRPDLVNIDDLWTCMACGALSSAKASTNEEQTSAKRIKTSPSDNRGDSGSIQFASESDWLNMDELRHRSNVPAYKHAKLGRDKGQKSIRLINLFFGRYDDPIQCSIHHVDLADRPHYEAVSYTWADETGDANLSSTIYCSKTSLRVTKNCEQALRRIRHPAKSRWIWLDAVAINQNDIGERNHQVALMKEVYSQAYRVLIYAGETSHSSDDLLCFLRGPSKDGCQVACPFRKSQHNSVYMQDAITRFLSRRWFQRTWVLQEAYLAARATIIVGEMTLDWSLMCKARLIELGLHDEENNAALPAVLEWMSRRYANDIDLLFALTTTRACLATDPRDKVFAVLGLLHDPSAIGFEVNYSWTLREVLTQVAVHLITTLNSIDILRYAGETSTDSAIPSWAPRWSIESGEALVAQFTGPVTPIMNTVWEYDFERKSLISVSTRQIHNHSITDMRFAASMVISGVCLDTIQYVLNDEFMEKHDGFGLDGWIRKGRSHKAYRCACRLSFLARLFPIGSTDDLSALHSHNLGGWSYPVLFSTGVQSKCHHCIDLWLLETPDANEDIDENGWTPEHAQLVEAFNVEEMDVFGKQCKLQGTSRVNFQTHLTLGFGPKSMRCGDTIWRIRDLAVLLVLRRFGEDWQVVGECYLHGAERFDIQGRRENEESITLR
jgi:hypothetical protein